MKKLFVIGSPITHSLSPIMHMAAIRALGLEEEFSYELRDVPPYKIAQFIGQIRSGEVFGANVTIPNKIEAFAAADTCTPEALLAESVNTLFLKDGKVWGHSTDGIGCIRALTEKKVSIEKKTFLLLGAGGAARAICFALLTANAKKVIVLNKTFEHAVALLQEVKKKTKKTIEIGSLEDTREFLKETDVCINCTPVGMSGKFEFETLLTRTDFVKKIVVMDLVYNPLETKLLKEAKAAKCTTIDGIGMLVHQGAASFELWTGKKAPVEVMRTALLNHFAKQ